MSLKHNHRILIFTAIIIGVSSISCRKTNVINQRNAKNTDTIEKLAPVESLAPNTNYNPAFPGQTRIFGIKTKTNLKIEVINNTLSNPWGISILPNGNLVITEKAGKLLVLNNNGNLLKTITNLPQVDANNQGGLLDIEVDPLYTQNKYIYWSYSSNEQNTTATTVAKGRLNDQYELDSITTIYTALPRYQGFLHYGGRLLFDNDGYLLITTGDRSDEPMRMNAQRLDNGLGKILRISRDGQIPTNNPFINNSSAEGSIWSYGHRNVQGIALDKKRNILYESELGPKGGDEINIIEAGKNYGWPVISYGLEYSGNAIGSGITQQQGMEQPIYYWDPVISPSGMIYYQHDLIPEWNDNLLIGALSGQHIIRLRIVNGKVAGEERLLESEGQRFRDLAVDPSGIVYAITDSGRLYKISLP